MVTESLPHASMAWAHLGISQVSGLPIICQRMFSRLREER
jgi:hypothetical protein